MIMRDVNYGWLIRYLHANGASFFFIFVYLHIGRGMYYGSYKSPRIMPWSIGVIILVLMMGTAFLGYSYSLTWLDIDIIEYQPHTLTLSILSLTASTQLQTILTKNNIRPVAVWENLDKPGIKTEIQKSIKLIGGIYIIVNLVTGKIYVGSAIVGRMGNRFHKHLFRGTGSPLVWAAVNK